MQSSTGQYSTQAGDPAQPVQHSVMTASSFGFFLRGVSMPFERGSCFSSSGTKPGAFAVSGTVAIVSGVRCQVSGVRKTLVLIPDTFSARGASCNRPCLGLAG